MSKPKAQSKKKKLESLLILDKDSEGKHSVVFGGMVKVGAPN
jgi:hypothetical protein